MTKLDRRSETLASVGVHEAKTQLSKLLERVGAGEEIVITNRGRVVARIVPDGASPRARVLGADRDKVVIPDSFYDPLPDDVMAGFA